MNLTAVRFATHARTWLLIAGLSALLVVIGGQLFGAGGYVIFAAIAIVMNFIGYWYSDRFAIRAASARPLGEDEDPELHAMVRELAQRAGVPVPRLFVIPSEQPNAFATGRNPRHAAIAVTEGIRRYMPADELRGVLAHEFAHIKNRDILVSSIAAMIAATITMIANVMQFGMLFGGGNDDDDSPLGAIGALLTIILAPIAAALLQLAVSRQREYLADATGAAIIGDARPLASALERLERGTAAIPMAVQPATASLYIANPLHAGGLGSLFQTHPPMADRIRRLRELRLA